MQVKEPKHKRRNPEIKRKYNKKHYPKQKAKRQLEKMSANYNSKLKALNDQIIQHLNMERKKKVKGDLSYELVKKVFYSGNTEILSMIKEDSVIFNVQAVVPLIEPDDLKNLSDAEVSDLISIKDYEINKLNNEKSILVATKQNREKFDSDLAMLRLKQMKLDFDNEDLLQKATKRRKIADAEQIMHNILLKPNAVNSVEVEAVIEVDPPLQSEAIQSEAVDSEAVQAEDAPTIATAVSSEPIVATAVQTEPIVATADPSTVSSESSSSNSSSSATPSSFTSDIQISMGNVKKYIEAGLNVFNRKEQ